MAITTVATTETQLQELLVEGLQGKIAKVIQERLEAELVPKLKDIIAEHIREVMKKFAMHRIALSRSELDGALQINITFAEKES